MQKFSYHTHTDFSDGHNTPEEMLQQAADLGWEEIGISDHLIVHKNIRQSFSWPRWERTDKIEIFHADFSEAADGFCRHADHLRKLARRYNLKVRVGAEVDFFDYDGWAEEFAAFRHRVGLDYCISGNHFLPLNNGKQILDAKDSAMLDQNALQAALRLHFATVTAAACSGMFAFIAHLDYLRKIPQWAEQAFAAEKTAVTAALAKSAVGTELSSKGIRKQGYFYPEENWLKQIIEADIPLVISDDAHRIEELGFEFDKAEALLQQLGCHKRWRFK